MVSITHLRSWGAAWHAPIAITAILLVAMAACAPMLWYGSSNGDDAETALAWMHNFSSQLRGGELYPRWLMDMNRGAGSPAFYFYAPFPFYAVSIPAIALSCYKLTFQLAWGDCLLIAMSGVAFYHYARRHSATGSSLFCSVLYMLLPYHFEIDLWVRQDLGELANYIWMPLVLYYTEEVFEHRRAIMRLAVSYALMLISHLPSTLLFSICLGGYTLVYLSGWRSLACLLRFSCGIVIGLLLAGIYWVPALFSQQYIHAEAWWIWYYDYHMWFFPVRDLSLFRNDIGSRSFNIRVFTVVVITTVIFALFWLTALLRRKITNVRRVMGYLILIGIAWFLMTVWSAFVWESVPLLRKVQFPYRLSMVVDLATAITALHAMQNFNRRDLLAAVSIVMSLALLAWCLVTADMKRRLDPFGTPSSVTMRDNGVRSGVDAPEYTTRWSPFDENSEDNSEFLDGREKLVYEAEHGTIAVAHWRPRDIELSVNLHLPTQISVRQFYFPNWRAATEDGTLLPVVPSKQNGLILIALPAGHYRLTLELEPLRQEMIGAIVSLGGLLSLLILSAWHSPLRDFLRGTSAARPLAR
jgi:6-pyruvoyl-tetrahydropterin synthase related domain